MRVSYYYDWDGVLAENPNEIIPLCEACFYRLRSKVELWLASDDAEICQECDRSIHEEGADDE